MKYTGIDQITYGVDDMAAGKRFFADWGLRQEGDEEGEVRYQTLDGTIVALRPLDDPALPPAFEEGPTLREVIWGVDGSSDIDDLRTVLAGEESYREIDGRPACTDPNGMTLSFRVSRRVEVDAPASPINTYAQPNVRIDRQSTFYDRAAPIEIGHVVFFANDVPETEKFYMEKLGFVMSDRYPGSGAFLRCRPEGGHHNLFLLQVPNRGPGLNHVAFTVRDIHEVFGGGLHIDRCGWTTQIGPGRHPVSSAYFWYVENPCGGLAEYFADEDYLTESWQPRDFDRTNENYAEWGIGGGIDGNSRRQHLP